MEVKAHARTQRIAPRKARLVLEQIVGKPLSDAIVIANNTDKKVSPMVFKLLTSCAANAQNNHQLDLDNLYVKEAFATDGPTMKRIRPRAQGRASQILKRTSHITVVLAEK